MSKVVVDASVWVAAQDPADPFCTRSRAFFSHTVAAGIVVHVPAFALVEVACALARKLRNPVSAGHLAKRLFHTTGAREYPVSGPLLDKALSIGTTKFLRGADALYSAAAELAACELVSWDHEHLQRAGALTPDNWLLANP
jgi:predicted nucleic acid-binding protein